MRPSVDSFYVQCGLLWTHPRYLIHVFTVPIRVDSGGRSFPGPLHFPADSSGQFTLQWTFRVDKCLRRSSSRWSLLLRRSRALLCRSGGRRAALRFCSALGQLLLARLRRARLVGVVAVRHAATGAAAAGPKRKTDKSPRFIHELMSTSNWSASQTSREKLISMMKSSQSARTTQLHAEQLYQVR